MSLDESLGIDNLLQVLSCMNAAGLARMACTSRFGSVASHEAQKRPSLLVLKGSPEDVARDLKEKLATKPTVAFLQYSSDRMSREDRGYEMLDFVKSKLPADTEVIGAQTESLQCIMEAPSEQGSGQRKGTASASVLQVGDSWQHIGLLLATLPEANAKAFHVKDQPRPSGRGGFPSDSESDSEYGYDSEGEEEEEDDGVAEQEQGENQEREPEEQGRSDGDTTKAKSQVQAAATSIAEAAQDPELAELLALNPAPQVIVIHLACRSAKLVGQLQKTYPEAAIIGGVVMGQEVVIRSKEGRTGSVGRGVGVLTISGNCPLFAMTSPFTGSQRTAKEDVKKKMQRAQELAIEQDRRLLGALLFTCNARSAGMFNHPAYDASVFQAQFPGAQLLGYYAGGEIGPAVSENADEDTKNAFLRGSACMQGFTAVFGFFLVPQKFNPSTTFQRAVLFGEVKEAFDELRRSG